MRSPWAGRLWEAFGEDPYLAGVATSETVQGIQSQDVVCSYITRVPILPALLTYLCLFYRCCYDRLLLSSTTLAIIKKPTALL